MDTLTIDVRDIPDEKIRQLQRMIEQWKQDAQLPVSLPPIKKRRVDPSEFMPRSSKLKAPYSRSLAYEE